jgi:diketogulonate reductase-like aldo/keto reductase
MKVDGKINQIPDLIYGTAWKEEKTQPLVEMALRAGFRGIDTANQRRHYHEAAVGQAIAACIKNGTVLRPDLFVQTKFTFIGGQDERLPYDAKAPIDKQVEQSFAKSLEHLGIETIDSYLLHGPTRRSGLATEDWVAWRAIEAIQESGQASFIGVSNFTVDQLRALCAEARIQPKFVQNRCYAARGWDAAVRQFCHERGIIYQGFSLLTANPAVVTSPAVQTIAKRHGRSAAEVVFRFAVEIGILPLTGTSNEGHMRADLDVRSLRLDPEEVRQIPLVTSP